LGFQIISNRFWGDATSKYCRYQSLHWVEAAQIVVVFVVLIVSYIVQTILDSPNAIGL
jgi:hypothetical protein